MNSLRDLKQGLEGTLRTVGEGWRHLREQASGALTRFTPAGRPGADKGVAEGGPKADSPPQKTTSLSEWQFPSAGWALLAGDLYEDDSKLVVRLEIPGLDKDQLDLEVRDDNLIVRGEKRLDEQASDGHYRIRQCAYGSFHRSIALPRAVKADQAKAEYRNGVLRIELPKSERHQGRRIEVKGE
ncbi:MAG: Hsp20/alpha crystallin family protein [Pseudomonas sp.]|uniref:Hsp20/alpha crystallin family protein n=1 Tax=Pseudomonas sp. TaxID=306 RepID=UPI0033959339